MYGCGVGSGWNGKPHELAAAVANGEVGHLEASTDQFGGHSELVQHFERMGVNYAGPRGVEGLREFVDQQVIGSRLLETESERQARGACSYDDDVGLLRDHISSSWWFLFER